MQITHAQARRFIQLNTDHALTSSEQNILFAHLKACSECTAYADEIKEVDGFLLPVMRRHWSGTPIPLSIVTLTEQRKAKIQTSTLLVMRTALTAFVFVAFIFSAWQYMGSSTQTPVPSAAEVLPAPTPSSQSTRVKITPEDCELELYTVQRNDTLASIANQFAVSTTEITTLNNLETEMLHTSMQLMIPICSSTPTGTVHPATFTTTYTPALDRFTSTPDG